MKCHNMGHFIWVFTVCKSTRYGVSSLKRVNSLHSWIFDCIFFSKSTFEKSFQEFNQSVKQFELTSDWTLIRSWSGAIKQLNPGQTGYLFDLSLDLTVCKGYQ